MEVLDDNIPREDKDSPEYHAMIARMKNDYSALLKKVNNGRIALGLVFAFTLLSVITGFMTGLSGAEIVGILVVAVIFGICAAIQPKYARFSIAVGLALYILDTLAVLLQPSFVLIFAMLIKVTVIYFLVVALGAAYKMPGLLKKMKAYNIRPYRY